MLELDVELELVLELDDVLLPDTLPELSSLYFHDMGNVFEQVVEPPVVHAWRSAYPFSSSLPSLYIMIINESNELRRVAVIVAEVIFPAGKTASLDKPVIVNGVSSFPSVSIVTSKIPGSVPLAAPLHMNTIVIL